MAKKKPTPKRSPPLKPLRPKEVEVVDPGSRKRPAERTAKPKKEKSRMSQVILMPAAETPSVLIPAGSRRSLAAWLTLYMKIDGEASAETTQKAKMQDLERFLEYFERAMRSDDKQLWTRSVSEGFWKDLQKRRSDRTGKKLAPTTVNRIMATLRTAARWIHSHEPFVAGNPVERIKDISTPEPVWQGLTDIEMVRMKAAADQLVTLSVAANQWPKRDYALFHVLYATAMRVTELTSLDIDQYDGKYLRNVKRKGRNVTPEIFLVKSVREALDEYIDEERKRDEGPLFRSRTGKALAIQQVDYVLKKIAGQANATLPEKERIHAHPHILRHTMLRRVREEKGLAFAIEYAGHVSEKYIRRYTMPSREEKEATLEELFG